MCLCRHSKDLTVNTFGLSLIDLCCQFDVHILNGRIGKDKNSDFTYIRENKLEGCSVINYVYYNVN